jgi:adenosylcobinamide-GDP ribazoletransferase
VIRLILAIQFLTRIPLPNVKADIGDFAASMRWFPFVGLLVGGIVAGAAWAGAWLDPWSGALAGLAAWVLVTGALHLDGLSDFVDASGAAHKDRARFVVVMTDPHIGSFGVVAIVLQLIAKLVLLHALIDAGPLLPLILVPAAARIGPLVWTRWLASLRSGLAARFANTVRIRDIAGWFALLAASAVFAPAILIAPVLIALWWLWLHKRVGGVSGDCHGAGIELVETGLLLALLVWAAVP